MINIMNEITQRALEFDDIGPVGVHHQTCGFVAMLTAPPTVVYLGESELAELEKFFYCKLYHGDGYTTIPALQLKIIEVKQESYISVG